MSTGRELHTATLLPGGEVLVAAGNNGLRYQSSAELYVSDGGIVLEANAHTAEGNNVVVLQWRPRDGGTVDILRQGAVVKTTANDGIAKDNIGSNTGTITYQVCDTSSGTCSNEATVRIP
jgi:hypothetical protein